MKSECESLNEKLESTEDLLLALQRAYTAKAAEMDSFAQFRLSDEEEEERMQSAVTASGRPACHPLPPSALLNPSVIRVRALSISVRVYAHVCSPAKTVFDDIVAKTSPAEIVFEDDATLAFRDINPVAPVQCVHIL